MKKIEGYSENTFEQIKHINKHGQEFWYARELADILEYNDFRNFENVIFKSMQACENSNFEIVKHFGEITRMVELGSKAKREIKEYVLSRYACYLVVMNCDPNKEVVAIGQTYFAVKTRQQELIENYDELTENQKRIAIRKEMKMHNTSLAEAARMAGIETSLDYAVFQNHGYRGLYGGLTAKDIRARKGLNKNQQILDYMGSTELAANLFRATQTDEKLRRENINGKHEANLIHYDVGKKVRQTIKELGGTMPEKLPTPDKSITQIMREQKKLDSEKNTD